MADQGQQSNKKEVEKEREWEKHKEKIEKRGGVLHDLWRQEREALELEADLTKQYDQVSQSIEQMPKSDKDIDSARQLLKEINRLIKNVKGIIKKLRTKTESFEHSDRGKKKKEKKEDTPDIDNVVTSFAELRLRAEATAVELKGAKKVHLNKLIKDANRFSNIIIQAGPKDDVTREAKELSEIVKQLRKNIEAGKEKSKVVSKVTKKVEEPIKAKAEEPIAPDEFDVAAGFGEAVQKGIDRGKRVEDGELKVKLSDVLGYLTDTVVASDETKPTISFGEIVDHFAWLNDQEIRSFVSELTDKGVLKETEEKKYNIDISQLEGVSKGNSATLDIAGKNVEFRPGERIQYKNRKGEVGTYRIIFIDDKNKKLHLTKLKKVDGGWNKDGGIMAYDYKSIEKNLTAIAMEEKKRPDEPPRPKGEVEREKGIKYLNGLYYGPLDKEYRPHTKGDEKGTYNFVDKDDDLVIKGSFFHGELHGVAHVTNVKTGVRTKVEFKHGEPLTLAERKEKAFAKVLDDPEIVALLGELEEEGERQSLASVNREALIEEFRTRALGSTVNDAYVKKNSDEKVAKKMKGYIKKEMEKEKIYIEKVHLRKKLTHIANQSGFRDMELELTGGRKGKVRFISEGGESFAVVDEKGAEVVRVGFLDDNFEEDVLRLVEVFEAATKSAEPVSEHAEVKKKEEEELEPVKKEEQTSEEKRGVLFTKVFEDAEIEKSIDEIVVLAKEVGEKTYVSVDPIKRRMNVHVNRFDLDDTKNLSEDELFANAKQVIKDGLEKLYKHVEKKKSRDKIIGLSREPDYKDVAFSFDGKDVKIDSVATRGMIVQLAPVDGTQKIFISYLNDSFEKDVDKVVAAFEAARAGQKPTETSAEAESWKGVVGNTYRLYSGSEGYPDEGLDLTVVSVGVDDVKVTSTDLMYGDFEISKINFLELLRSKDPKGSLKYVDPVATAGASDTLSPAREIKSEGEIVHVSNKEFGDMIYGGDWKEGTEPHGEGTTLLPEGGSVTGTWEDGELKGRGKADGMKTSDGGIYTGSVIHIDSSEFIFDGTGQVTWPKEGSIYGDWESGFLAGTGLAAKLKMSEGIYSGRVVQDEHGTFLAQGQGKMALPDGTVKQGEWDNNELVPPTADTPPSSSPAEQAQEEREKLAAEEPEELDMDVLDMVEEGSPEFRPDRLRMKEKRARDAKLRQAVEILQYKGFWKKKWLGIKREPVISNPMDVLRSKMSIGEEDAFAILMKLEQQGKIKGLEYDDRTHPIKIKLLVLEKEQKPQYEFTSRDIMDIVGTDRLQAVLEKMLDIFANNAGGLDDVKGEVDKLFKNLSQDQQKVLDDLLEEKGKDFVSFQEEWDSGLSDRIARGLQYYILASLERDIYTNEELRNFEEEKKPKIEWKTKADWKRNLWRGFKSAVPAIVAGTGVTLATGGIGSLAGLAAAAVGSYTHRVLERRDFADETKEAKMDIDEKRREAIAIAQERFATRMENEGSDIFAAYISSLLKEPGSTDQEYIHTKVLNDIRKEAEKSATHDPETQNKTMEYLLAALEMRSPVGGSSAFNRKAAKMGSVMRSFSEAWTVIKGGRLRDLWKNDESKGKRFVGDVLNAGVAGVTGAAIGLAIGSMALKGVARGAFGFGKGFFRTLWRGKAETKSEVLELEIKNVQNLMSGTREQISAYLEKGSLDIDDKADLAAKNGILNSYLKNKEMLENAPELRAEIEATIESINTTGAMFEALGALEDDLDDRRSELESAMQSRMDAFTSEKDRGKFKAIKQGIKEGTLVVALGASVDGIRDLEPVKDAIKNVTEWVADVGEWVANIFSSTEPADALGDIQQSQTAGQVAEQAPAATVAPPAPAQVAEVVTSRSPKVPDIETAIEKGLATKDAGTGKITPKEGYMLVQNAQGQVTVAPDENNEWVNTDKGNLEIKPIAAAKVAEVPTGPKQLGETKTFRELNKSTVLGAQKALFREHGDDDMIRAIAKKHEGWAKYNSKGEIINKDRIIRNWSMEQAKKNGQWFDSKAQYFTRRTFASTEISFVVGENGYPQIEMGKYQDLGYIKEVPRTRAVQIETVSSSGGGTSGEAETTAKTGVDAEKSAEQKEFDAAKERFAVSKAASKEDWLAEKAEAPKAAERILERKTGQLLATEEVQGSIYTTFAKNILHSDKVLTDFARDYIQKDPTFNPADIDDVEAFEKAWATKGDALVKEHGASKRAASAEVAATAAAAGKAKTPEVPVVPEEAPREETKKPRRTRAKQSVETKGTKKVVVPSEAETVETPVARATARNKVVVGKTENEFTPISQWSRGKAVDIKIPASYAATTKGLEPGKVALIIDGDRVEGKIKFIRPKGGGAPRPVLEYQGARTKKIIEIEEASRGKVTKVPKVEVAPDVVVRATKDNPIQVGATKKGITPVSAYNTKTGQVVRLNLPESYRAQTIGKEIVIRIDNEPTMGRIEFKDVGGDKTPKPFLVYEKAMGKKVEILIEKATIVKAGKTGGKGKG